MRKSPAGFVLERLAIAFTNNPGYPLLHVHSDKYRISDGDTQYEVLILPGKIC
jgi:hypothetical protein